MKGRAFFVNDANCPYCGTKLNAASHAKGKDVAPEAGDISLCIRCAGLLVYVDRFSLRAATYDEWREMKRDRDVVRARKAIKFLNSLMERKK